MIRWCVENKPLVVLFAVLLIIGGAISYAGLERQENPTVVAPAATIQCIYPGASPEDIEKMIIKPIEEELGEITGIKTLESYAVDSIGIVTITLYDMSDGAIEQVWDEVKDQLDQVQSKLPEEAESPTLDKDLSQSYALVLGLTSADYTHQDFKAVAASLKNRLIHIEGVAAVDFEGEIKEEIQISLDLVKLNQYQLTAEQIATVLKARNINIPGGNLLNSGYKFPVQITGEYENVTQIKNTIVGVSPESGLPVYLHNVANVTRTEEEPDVLALVNNEKALLIGVQYAEKQNVLHLGQQVMEEIESFRSEVLPHHMELVVLNNQSDYVQESTSLFINNLLSAIVLVVLVVWAAMGKRSAVVVSLPIVLVIAAVFSCMYVGEIPLHQVSIASLIICLSLLIANGIVANDNIYLHLTQGADRMTASVNGVKQVTIPILTSTLTTIASFLPLAMMQGVAGKFVTSLPILVSIALLTSFFTALTIIPAAGHKLLQVNPPKVSPKSSHSKSIKVKEHLNRKYGDLLSQALKRPMCTVGIFACLFIICIMILPTLSIQIFPPIERDQYVLCVSVPDGFTTQHTGKVAEQISQVLSTEDSVHDYSAKIGEGYMKYYVTFVPHTRDSSTIEFLINGQRSRAYAVAEKISASIPDALVNVKMLEINMPQDYPVQIRLSGKDLDQLQEVAEEVQTMVTSVPGTRNPTLNIGYSSFKQKITVNEDKASLVGISNYDVASTVRMAVNGSEITTLKQSDIDQDSIPVVMKMSDTENRTALHDIFITSSVTGEYIALDQIADIQTESSRNKIIRRNQERTVTIGVFLEDGANAQDLTTACAAALADFNLPEGVQLEWGGEIEFTEETLGGLVVPALLTLMLIYAILAFQFKHLLEPLIIMGTIPLSFIGIILGLRLLSYPLGFMALLGAISLMGVVVNNGIVLLDYIKIIETNYESLPEAIIAGCQTRIRPIMIGMITTVISLLPLAISGGSLWAPLATSITFGMVFSTALTLIFVPCLYLILHRQDSK